MAAPSTPTVEPRLGQRQLLQIGDLVGRFGAPLGLIVLCIYLTISSPYFLTLDNIANIGRQSAVTATLALGQLIVILTAGIDLSVGATLALSGVILAQL